MKNLAAALPYDTSAYYFEKDQRCGKMDEGGEQTLSTELSHSLSTAIF